MRPVLKTRTGFLFARKPCNRHPNSRFQAPLPSHSSLLPALIHSKSGNGRNRRQKPAKKGMREMAQTTATTAQKRTIATEAKAKRGLTTQDLILIAVLLAAGAVLKLTVASFFASFGMKPNFIIAMYCLAIILTRPTVSQSAVIGLIAGLICQIPMLNATPLLNIPSELLGALVCGLLIKLNLNIGKLDLNPIVNTFVSTCISGGTFALLAIYINVVSTGGDVAVALAAYAAIVLGTATINAIMVQILVPPLRKVLKK